MREGFFRKDEFRYDAGGDAYICPAGQLLMPIRHGRTERQIRRWLLRRSGRKGTGFGQIPDEYLYETLGLYTVPRNRSDLPRAKI